MGAQRKPQSVWLDLFAGLHFVYATLFFIGPATDLGGLTWFPFYFLGTNSLILAWGIWMRRLWSRTAGIAMSVLFPATYAVGLEREWSSGSWGALGYLLSLFVVVPLYVVELAGNIWLLVPSGMQANDDISPRCHAKSTLLERTVLAALLVAVALTDCLVPRHANLNPGLVISVGLTPVALGLFLLTCSIRKSKSRVTPASNSGQPNDDSRTL